MSEDNDQPRRSESLNATVTKASPSTLLTPTNILLSLAAVIVLSIAYYFVIALPQIKRDALDWEKQKYNQEVSIKKAEEQRIAEQKAQNETMLNLCINGAEETYISYVKLNGSPVKNEPGVYRATTYVWNEAAKKKKAALDECYRQYSQ